MPEPTRDPARRPPTAQWLPIALAAGLAVVLALGLGAWFLASAPVAEPVGDPVSTHEPAPPVPELPAAPEPAPMPEPELPEVQAPPSDPLDDPASAASAHAAVAAELSLVAIRCPLPPGLPTQPPVGSFLPDVVDGWYSDVVRSLEGEQGAELRFGPASGGPLNPDVRFEVAYVVSWKAERWGEAVRCAIRPLKRGDLAVLVTDEAGAPLDGIEVSACGQKGTTVAGRIVLTQVWANEDCAIRVLHTRDDLRCMGKQEVRVPAGGRLQVTMPVRCGEVLDPELIALSDAWMNEIRQAFRGEADYKMDAAAELAVFGRLRGGVDDGTPGAELYDRLIAHREEIAARDARRKELKERMNSTDLAESDAAIQELLDLD